MASDAWAAVVDHEKEEGMARQQPAARKQSPSKRDKQEATGTNGHDDEVASYEKELAGYLQERIRPGLYRGSIPLLARSIAKEIAHRERPNDASEDAEAEQSAEAEDRAVEAHTLTDAHPLAPGTGAPVRLIFPGAPGGDRTRVLHVGNVKPYHLATSAWCERRDSNPLHLLGRQRC